MKLTIDLTQNGLDSVFVPWEKTAVTILCEGGEYMSGALTDEINRRVAPEDRMSQASVVGLLKDLYALRIVEEQDVFKKSGELSKYKSYYSNYDLDGLCDHLASLAENWALYTRNNSSTKTVTMEES